MLHTLVAGLLSLLPQAPAPTGTAPAPQAPAKAPTVSTPGHWLPADTLFALTLAPFSQNDVDRDLKQAADFTKTIGTLVELLPLPEQLDAATLTRTLRNGAAFAWLPGDAKQTPNLLLVAATGERGQELVPALATLPSAGGNGRVRVANGPTPLYFALADGHLAIGTVQNTVTAALDRAAKPNGKTLADDALFAQSQPTEGTPLVHAWVRLDGALKSTVERLPGAALQPMRALQRTAGLDKLQCLSAAWLRTGDDLVAQYRLGGTDIPAWLGALAGAAGRLDTTLANVVPTTATGFTFGAIDLANVIDQLLPIVSAIVPDAGKSFDAMLARIETRTGLDARAVLLGGLAGRTVTVSGAGGETAVLFELKQGANYARALPKLVPALQLPVQTGTCAGVACWRLQVGEPDAPKPAFAVVGNWLVLASTDVHLAALTQQIQQPQPNAAAVELLRSADASTSWLGRGPVALPGPMFAELQTALADLGDRRTALRRIGNALVLEDRVPAADFFRAFAAVGTLAGEQLAALRPASARHGGQSSGDAAAVAQLKQAEKSGPTPESVPAIELLLEHADPKIAARAAWLLGDWKIVHAAQALANAVTHHTSPLVRVQAMGALARIADESVLEAVTTASSDGDPKVRTFAAQALGRIQTKIATAALLAMLDKNGKEPRKEAPDDLIAALLALHDRGDTDNLLPAATAIGWSQPQLGQALTYLFQELSPKLQPKTEAQTLMAVLDHPEPLLRHYAIQRLGELRDPTTASALEARLAKEGPDLQPLVHVSLAQVRGDGDKAADDLLGRARNNVAAITQMIAARWNGLQPTAKASVIGLTALILGGGIVVLLLLRRSRRRAHAEAAAAMVAPSADYSPRPQQRRPQRELVGSGRDERR